MPARNARERTQIARIAALSRSATESGRDRLAAANATYRESFNVSHECNVCKRVDIDQELPAEEIARRGAALYRRHMQALALKRDRNRRVADELEAEAAAADEELTRVAAAE
jgi:hypothetical protein